MSSKRLFPSAAVSALVVFWAACGGAPVNQQANFSGGVPVSLTMGDTPPAGVTVLSFEITVTGAVLQPGSVSLLNAPIKVEVEKLQTETAFLNTAGVAPPAVPFISITVTFASPELTIFNGSSAAIGTCAIGATCELKPPLTSASVSVFGPPLFPLIVTANNPVGLLLDFNLTQSIQSDLSINPSVTFTQLPALVGTGKLEELEEVLGRVTAIDPTKKQFTLQISNSPPLIVMTDANTEFENFDKIGMANSFSSLAVGQNVEVDLRLNSDGTLLAHKVELQQEQPNEEELEGIVTSVDSATQFKIVALEEVPDIAGVEPGNAVTVTLQSGAGFRVDTDDLSLPSDVHFMSSADLMVGQVVEIRLLSGSSGTNALTDRVTLKMGQLTAKVESVGTNSFKVNNLPSLFTSASPAVTEINVVVTSQTEFENVSSVAALIAGDAVSVKGLLFKTTGIPEIVAKKVRKR